MPVQVAPPMTGLVPLLLAMGIAVFLLALVRAVLRLRRAPGLEAAAVAVAAAVGLAACSGALGYGIYSTYVSSNTWTFSYYAYLQPNGSGPDAVVLPAVVDTQLLSGLRVVEGAGNWSFVNTTHGLGVYVAFTGVVALSVNHRAFPPPRPPPSTGITMANGSGVGPGDAWVYYPGTAGVWLSFGTNAFATSATLRTGWNLCRFLPPPVAVP